MSTTILPVFDKSLNTTAIWLGEIMDEIGPDRAFAWRVLSVVLQRLRDHLPLELLAHFGAQLPLVVRGTYYDGFDPTILPRSDENADGFLKAVGAELGKSRGIDPALAAGSVFGVLGRHVSQGQIDKIIRTLPRDIRALWTELATSEN
ncbi:DUF2267 domain-containing protein [Erythrobacter insulae]|uniref:DUF2267 domain-containing protein n=1 Tax=Erythrobacter insulae TaxID=2584124 RepID=A0A547PBW1_9SPHN|nr:DUF2267 domain-containing protein [Erythrobacter insulae]TRD11627.1 DUF2267 domain-containing protein [Erythrobacter insulae]